MDKIHKPVLLKESLESLNIVPDGFYIDCTLGDGGHSFEIFSKLSDKGLLLSIDQDQYAIDFVKEYYKENIKENWIIKRSNFRKIADLVSDIHRKPDGILLDLFLETFLFTDFFFIF